MLDEQSAKILAVICRSLDDIEQGRDNFKHLRYEIVRKNGTEAAIHIIIARKEIEEEYEEEYEH